MRQIKLQQESPERRNLRLLENFLKKPFAQLLCHELAGVEQSKLPPESMVSRMFSKDADLKQRYHPSVVRLLSTECSGSIGFIRQAAIRAIVVGEESARTQPEAPTAEDGADSIVNCFAECAGNGELAVDSINATFNTVFNTQRHDLGERSQRIAQRIFWRLLGFSISQSGRPILWNTPS